MMDGFNSLVLLIMAGLFVFCLLFLPVFVWQIRNATQKTNRLLQQLIDQGAGKKSRTRHDITGLIGDQGVDRK